MTPPTTSPPFSLSDAAQVAALVREKKVIVCCGAGGVGKTTTAAALGLAAARAGRKVLVLTIDPARRLAEAMGIPASAAKPSPVPHDRLIEAGVEGGELHAWMLNPAAVFESMVRRLSPSPERAEKLLANRLYRHLSELVAGMQEYTAAEALYELSTSNVYDLVVLDTPPSRNALEFLEAPGRLARFLDERILGFFLPDGTRKRGFWKKASELVNGLFARVFGAQFYEELQQFFGAASGMFASMRVHAEGVKQLLSSREAAAFLLVTSPEQAEIAEAVYLRDKILSMDLPFAGFVLNRSYAFAGGFREPECVELPPDATDAAKTGLAKLVALARDERRRVERDRGLLARLKEHSPQGAVAIAAPHLGEAIEDLRGLMRLAQGLTEGDLPEAAQPTIQA
ncbi:MAG TPA: ArsA-related P-loop ATPase [Myxococcales bacterium]